MNKQVLKAFFGKFVHGGLRVRYWDGEEKEYGLEKPRAALIFRRPPPAGMNLKDPLLSLGEAYMDEMIDFEGDLTEIMRVLELNRDLLSARSLSFKLAGVLQSISQLALKQKQKKNIQHHYDLGNDFYATWLDETMSYSCAYFRNPDDSLFQAQMQKIDHTLKKLRLKAGERLLDIGSGWGWLIIRAAQQYQVHAVGITLSENQYQETLARINRLGLSDLVEVRLMDYLDLDGEQEQFDKIVSIGMFEHVGQEHLALYMKKVQGVLKPGGLFLLHSITGTTENPVNAWIDRYIFPGGYLPSLREIIRHFSDYDFYLLHAESLRLHYALTLDYWYRNFANHEAEFIERYGKRFVRMWGLYLQSCAANFRVSGINIYQLLVSKGLNNELPLTFADVYYSQ